MNKNKKLRILQIDIGGCEGCAVSILRSLPLLRDMIELHSPYLVDEELDLKNEYDVAFITGSVCINDDKRIKLLRELREKCKIIVAFGSCAAFSGITRFSRGGQEPKPQHATYQPINHVINVDYSIPGCPPPPLFVKSFITALLKNMQVQLRLFRSLSKVKKLSGFDLLDDIVLPGLCIGCGACELSCPTGAIKLINKRPDLIVEKCIRCGTCYARCPRGSQLLMGVLK